jgi:hypothetical protein
MHTKVWLQNFLGRGHLGDRILVGKIILKQFIKKYVGN